MKVLIWGVACVGKTEVGKLLAAKLKYKFIDINEIIKQKYGTIDNYFASFTNDYDRLKEKEKIVLDVIKKNDNFIMTITLIYIKEIVENIINADAISVELIDSLESIYDRIQFYDENDQLMPDSKEYRDKHKKHYIKQLKNDMTTSSLEYKDIPKFDLKDRKFEDVIDDLKNYIIKLYKNKK